jgi:hypothetical protein
MTERFEETAAGIARLEGYLLNQAALRDAREQADAFARTLTWLGPSEQEEISDRLTHHHLRLRREMLAAIVARAQELRGEYEGRYACLRRRVTGLAVIAFGLLSTTVMIVCRI